MRAPALGLMRGALLIVLLSLAVAACLVGVARATVLAPANGPTLSAGWFHSCAVKSSGSLVCWGRSTEGQLAPAVSPGSVTQISAGGGHTCAVKQSDGKPVCWGLNASGQRSAPNISAKQITTGGSHSCALKSDNTIACWGSNVGFGGLPAGQSTPPAITATQITSSENHNCAIKTDNTAVCWGDNYYGQRAVPANLGAVSAISAGAYHTCAIRSADSKVVCWGYNGTGGNDVPPSLGAASRISTGEVNACAVKTNGMVVCWGADSYGQSTVPTGLGAVSQISAGYFHTCAVKTTGPVVCWGDADGGRTGGPPLITSGPPTTTLGAGAFTHTFVAGPASGPAASFSVTSGSLPAGITLNATTGVMSGTPTTDGAYAATVVAANGIFAPDSAQAFTLTVDRTAPARPAALTTSPVSPSKSPAPNLTGTAEAGSTVKIYGTAACSGAVLASGTAATFASPGFSVTVAANTTRTFYATATDAAGNVSPCSTANVTFVNDLSAPAAPSVLATTPSSPSSSIAPKVTGSAEAASTVKIFNNSTCSGTPLASGAAAILASPGLGVSASPDATTTFYASATDPAGNISNCSASGVAFANDSTAPARPTGLATTPASPSYSLTPKITGNAAAGSTVKIFANAACSGSPLTSGAAAAFASPGLTVTVAANTTQVLYATATDAVGNASTCSNAGVTFLNDSSAPTAPTALAPHPGSPSSSLAPKITGSAESGSTVKLFANATCSGNPAAGGSASAFASQGIVITVQQDSTTTIYANATDAAGNVSPCSSSGADYFNDLTLPAAPSGVAISPISPSSEISPLVSGAAEPGSTVSLFDDLNCAGSPVATGTADDFASPGIAITATADATIAIYATVVDSAGNSSGCGATGVDYTNDSTAPVAPGDLAVTPASPSRDLDSVVSGLAETDANVRIYDNAVCTGAPLAIGTAAEFASPGIALTVASDSSTTLYANATDEVNLTSPCSAVGATYVNDRTAPGPPVLLATNPASPSTSTTPAVVGSAEPGSSVSLFSDPACSGTPLVIGSAADLASPGLSLGVVLDSTTAIYALATDQAGNSSVCSAPILYTQQQPGPTGDTGGTGETQQPTPPVTPPPPTPPTAKQVKTVIQGLNVPRCVSVVAGKPSPAIAFRTSRAARVKVSVRRRVSPMLAIPSRCPRSVHAPATTTKFKTVRSRTTDLLPPGRYRINLTRELRGLAPGFYRVVLLATPEASKSAERTEFYLWKLN